VKSVQSITTAPSCQTLWHLFDDRSLCIDLKKHRLTIVKGYVRSVRTNKNQLFESYEIPVAQKVSYVVKDAHSMTISEGEMDLDAFGSSKFPI